MKGKNEGLLEPLLCIPRRRDAVVRPLNFGLRAQRLHSLGQAIGMFRLLNAKPPIQPPAKAR